MILYIMIHFRRLFDDIRIHGTAPIPIYIRQQKKGPSMMLCQFPIDSFAMSIKCNRPSANLTDVSSRISAQKIERDRLEGNLPIR